MIGNHTWFILFLILPFISCSIRNPYTGNHLHSHSINSKHNFPKAIDVNALDLSSLRPVFGQVRTFDGKKPLIAEYVPLSLEGPWTWACVQGVCKRQIYLGLPMIRTSLDVCWLVCGPTGPLWPIPKMGNLHERNLTSFHPKNVVFEPFHAPGGKSYAMLGAATKIFLGNLQKMFKPRGRGPRHSTVWISIGLEMEEESPNLTLETEEFYTLRIYEPIYKDDAEEMPYFKRGIHFGRTLNVDISGKNFYGLRHGLETLLQLIAFDEFDDSLKILNNVEIKDFPSFPYRGLMIDTGRNFIPIPSLKKVIEGMSMNKMNILHWHLSDSDSFPFYARSVPLMTKYGAYSLDKVYRPFEVAEFIEFARVRGVKIIPEIDVPAHAGNGWQWGPLEGLGNLALCVDRMPWQGYSGQPPAGILNPMNINTYLVLEKIYGDLLELFDNDLVHIGGDEISDSLNCLKENPDVKGWRQMVNSSDPRDPLIFFQKQAFKLLKKSSKIREMRTIIWMSTHDEERVNNLVPKENILQIWQGNSQKLVGFLKKGFKLILSLESPFYLDHGFGLWRADQDSETYNRHSWRDIYDAHSKVFRNITISSEILGGEAPLWSEKVDEFNMDMKIWPRGAALAERLWTNPILKSNEGTIARILHHRNRMVQRGVGADTVAPESCRVIFGYC